ncbi:MAG: cytochrome bd-I oxidase subunit CydX [Sphingomonas sp.]
MWYFSWILGVGLAVGFGILNGMWHEFHSDDAEAQAVEDPTPVLV